MKLLIVVLVIVALCASCYAARVKYREWHAPKPLPAHENMISDGGLGLYGAQPIDLASDPREVRDVTTMQTNPYGTAGGSVLDNSRMNSRLMLDPPPDWSLPVMVGGREIEIPRDALRRLALGIEKRQHRARPEPPRP